ncbi:MAG TPA: glutathione S-transferase N-terminal domain-containing protein [Polyangiaceae bacterium]|jgi:glutathione S-transferase
MKLITSPLSPYGRKVRIALLEKSLPCEVVNEAALPHNPLGKIPALMLDDSTSLFDSVVIVEYIEGVAPTPQLIPSEPHERALVRRWEALADGIADAAVLAMLEGRRAAELRDPSVVERQLGKVRAALAFAEAGLAESFAHGATFSLADAALVSAIGYLHLRHPDVLPSSPTPRLHAYLTRLATRPSIATTTPPA